MQNMHAHVFFSQNIQISTVTQFIQYRDEL